MLLEYNVPGPLEKTDNSKATKGRPIQKSSQAITALLDQIHQTEIGEQSDDTFLQADFIETEPESDSSPSSEEGPVAVAPIRQPAAKKHVAKVVDVSPDYDSDNDHSKDLMSQLL